LRWYGYDRELKQKNGDTDLLEAGWKCHMNDLSAAIGLGNLRSLQKPLEHRRALAKIYAQYGIVCHSWLAVGLLKETSSLDAFRLNMAFNGIEVGAYHFRNDKYTIFRNAEAKNLLTMNALEKRYVFLPYHTGVSKRSAHKIGKLYWRFR
jgi:dTDP-4-amino-4,6-dideoxygalactose transaminase